MGVLKDEITRLGGHLGGETKLSNLVSLCRFHHHALDEGGVQIVALEDGAFPIHQIG